MMVVAAAPYLVLAAVSFTMWRDVRARPRWEWLWAFGGLFALHLWIPLGEVFPRLERVQWTAGLLAGLAYLSLLEFARRSEGHSPRLPRWITGLGVLMLIVLVLAGFGRTHWPVSLLLGVPSGLLAMRVLHVHGRQLAGWGHRWAELLGLSLAAIPIVCTLAQVLLPDSAGGMGVLLFAGIVAALSAVTLDTWHVAQHHGRDTASNHLISATSRA
jgi:hypothetical protein